MKRQSRLNKLASLTVGNVERLITDLDLEADGAVMIFTIDPHEVFDFCFPSGMDFADVSPAALREIADDQAALWSVFYERREFAFLPACYTREMSRLLDGLSAETLFIGARSNDPIRRAAAALGVSERAEGALRSPEGIEEIRRNFSVFLALVMGLYKLEYERLFDICKRRLAVKRISSTAFSTEDTRLIDDVLDEWAPGTVYEAARSILLKSEPRYAGRSSLKFPAVRRERAERNAQADAAAMDLVINANIELERLYLDKRLSRRCVLLYLSSAERSARVFADPRVESAMPVINGVRYNVLRNRDEVYLRVICEGRGDTSVAESGATGISRALEAARGLRRLVGYRERLAMISEGGLVGEAGLCESCGLRGLGSGSADADAGSVCDWRWYCELLDDITDSMEKKSAGMLNLALCSSLGSFANLLEQAKASDDAALQELLSTLNKIDGSADMGRRVKSESYLLFQVALAKGALASFIPEGMARGRPLRSGQDNVTGAAQHLPIAPRIPYGDYAGIVDGIVRFYRNNTADYAILHDAYRAFMEIDNGIIDPLVEHEIVRCLLLLGLPTAVADEAALQLAAWLLGERFAERQRQEVLYVACWAARRLGRYEEALDYATRGLEMDGADPRFWHGRGLAIMSLYDTYGGGMRVPRVVDIVAPHASHIPGVSEGLGDLPESAQDDLTVALASFDRAVDLYQKAESASLDAERQHDLVAVCLNNSVYTYAMLADIICCTMLSGRRGERVNECALADVSEVIRRAREALGRLKSTMPRDRWSPRHPEYFHTEATLETVESVVVGVLLNNPSGGLEKAKHALRELAHAMHLSKRRRDTELRLKITSLAKALATRG